MVLGLRNVNSATSALLMPCVISASTSDSRSVRPSVRPGQSRPAALRVRRVGGSLMTISPACTASSAATRSRAGSVLDR